MANTGLQPSQIVTALANLASSGKYEVTPQAAKAMNALFEVTAELINALEEAEKLNAENEAKANENNDAPRIVTPDYEGGS